MNYLHCDTKTIPAPTVMCTDISSRKHGCALDRAVSGQVDGPGSVHATVGGVLNLSIYNDNGVYGSEPVNDL